MYDEYDYCESCKHSDVEEYLEPCISCRHTYTGKPTKWESNHKPKTNADRIRAMSDEELAKFICEWCNCVPGYCPGVDLCTPSMGKANGLVKWLKQPAEVPEEE